MPITPSPLEHWFTTHPGPYTHFLAGTAAAAPAFEDLRPYLPGDFGPWPLGYSEPAGAPELRALVAEEHGLTSDQVTLACGAIEANWLALASLLAPGDRAIVQQPIYPQLPLVAAALGADVTPWDGTLEGLLPLLDARVRVVVLNAPHNPTGAVVPRATLAAIAEAVAAQPRAHLLVDEVYRDLGGPPSTSAAGLPRTLVTGSVSKSWALPGLRVGWLVGPPETIAQATRWREHTVLANASPAEALVTALWPQRRALVAANQALLSRNRARVAAWLAAQGLDLPLPETAGCFLLPMPDDEAVAERWYAEGVMVVPGARLGYPGTLRLGYGHRDPAALDAALAFVARHSAILRP